MFPNDTDFESEFTFENSAAVPLPEEPPFHVLLLGDWRGNLNNNNLNERRTFIIDRDNFDEVLKKLNVGLELDLQGASESLLSLQFAELDDFHPDNLFRNVPIFSDLRDVRRRLSNPDTFDGAANEVRSWFDSPGENISDENKFSPEIDDAPPIESTNLLDMILTQPGSAPTSAKLQSVDSSELGKFVSKIVTPHLIRIDENEQTQLIAAVDETVSQLIRTILHHPKFQALESAWRGLYFLVRRLETDNNLKIFIFDISHEELTDNLQSVDNLTDSVLYQQLVDKNFAVIAGNYSFGLDVEDIASLMRIGKLAHAADAPFISYIKPEIFGLKNFLEKTDGIRFQINEDSKESKLWSALRSAPETGYIGLSPMRVLARMPYGETSDSVETFKFEEFWQDINFEKLLWMNPCFSIVLLLAQSYSLYGWEMNENLSRTIGNLPMYVFTDGGETKIMPCAEVVATENLLHQILEQGMIPLVSPRDSTKIQIARFQPVSQLYTNLIGKWNSGSL